MANPKNWCALLLLFVGVSVRSAVSEPASGVQLPAGLLLNQTTDLRIPQEVLQGRHQVHVQ